MASVRRIPRLAVDFIIPALAGFLVAGGNISDFHGKRENGAVVLEWTTESESNLERFEIERSMDRNRWFRIGELRAVGETRSRQTYTYRDNTIFKSSTNTYYYRLLLIDQNGQSSLHDVVVSMSGISGIRHTWGSIKAMFR
jgi:hypothetical protein